MTDIVERLRRQVSESPYDGFVSPLEAAAEIERLEADNARLRAALRKASDEIEMLRRVENDAAEWVEERTKRMRADNERLRAALVKISNSAHGSFDDAHVMADIARTALEDKDD